MSAMSAMYAPSLCCSLGRLALPGSDGDYGAACLLACGVVVVPAVVVPTAFSSSLGTRPIAGSCPGCVDVAVPFLVTGWGEGAAAALSLARKAPSSPIALIRGA